MGHKIHQLIRRTPHVVRYNGSSRSGIVLRDGVRDGIEDLADMLEPPAGSGTAAGPLRPRMVGRVEERGVVDGKGEGQLGLRVRTISIFHASILQGRGGQKRSNPLKKFFELFWGGHTRSVIVQIAELK